MTHYQYRTLSIGTNLIGVRFKTENFACISKVPSIEIKNLRVEFSEVIPSYDPMILAQLQGLQLFVDKKNFLEKLITIVANKNDLKPKADELIFSVAEHVRSSKGIVNIKEVAKHNHISLRQLERRFKQRTGLTIKEFSNVIRFRNAKEAISKFKETSLLHIAFDSGYFDHSHMNYEFNRIAGESPSHFR